MTDTEKQLSQWLLDHYNGQFDLMTLLKMAYAYGVVKGEALADG